MLRARRADGAPVGPADVDPHATPGVEAGKDDGVAALAARAGRLAELQELLYAQSTRTPASGRAPVPSLLLVVQAMDTAGKGGIMRHVVGQMDPQGVQVAAFKAPTPDELRHDFLWRVRPHLPGPGEVAVFDRSHYEDVLIGRVRQLADAAEIERRYGAIRAFEAELAASGTQVVKVMLHISKDEQRERLAERLDRPDKHWKFSPGDIDERALWDEYMEAYRVALYRTDATDAPWFIVPADRKWYARLAVQELLIETLEGLHLRWPEADFDVAEQRARLAAS
ncbi:PPK2 family polyphosphate kinase [Micrococcus sp.]|uniref:PPK2 family polyphosphate kinase n=1 Tax=Micrococcus sp. TaxID=1271 RepID=UPI002A9140AD|nr:PPK2 family polyphosphate kinase [Micrococcus sp.]MDY6055807.1 PPK2 family polyphosphate kinase [Micrococcus sp.]